MADAQRICNGCRTRYAGNQCPGCGRIPAGVEYQWRCRDCQQTFTSVSTKGTRPSRCKDCNRAHNARKVQDKRLAVAHVPRQRKCPDCGVAFEVVSRVGQGQGGSLPRLCRDCAERRIREYRKGKEYRRRLRRHGLKVETFDAILAAQGGCAVCKRPDPGDERGAWHIDHDHDCCPGPYSCGKCVRGVLCSRCNVMLGMALNDLGTLRAAVEYLSNPPAPVIVQEAEPPTIRKPSGRLTPPVHKG